MTTFPSSNSNSLALWHNSRTSDSGIGRQARNCDIALSKVRLGLSIGIADVVPVQITHFYHSAPSIRISGANVCDESLRSWSWCNVDSSEMLKMRKLNLWAAQNLRLSSVERFNIQITICSRTFDNICYQQRVKVNGASSCKVIRWGSKRIAKYPMLIRCR